MISPVNANPESNEMKLRISIAQVFIGAIFAVLWSGCSPSSDSGPGNQTSTPTLTDSTTIVATVENEPITLEEFEAELSRRAKVHPLSSSNDTAELRRRVLDEMIQFQATLAKAKSAGYHQDPRTVHQINQFIVTKFREDQLAAGHSPAPSVLADEKAIADFYQSHLDDYRTPESVRAGVIYFKLSQKADSAVRDERTKVAAAVLAQARTCNNTTFRQLVQQHSEHQATRYIGGDAGPLLLPDDNVAGFSRWGIPVVKAAFSLTNQGDCAPLVHTDKGLYIIRLIERQPASIRPLAEVRDHIAYKITHQRRQTTEQEFFNAMKQGLKIEINQPLLESVSIPTGPGQQTPPSLPKN